MSTTTTTTTEQSHNPAWGFVTKKPRLRGFEMHSHNPAWGFVTDANLLHTIAQQNLITPHGDS